ncbi:histidine kinase [Methylophaga sp. 41_12_T18]|nr:histidine kinase [Methylophaga sp. 41_12_T18]
MTNKQVVRVRDVMRTEFEVIDGMTMITTALQKMKQMQTKMLIIDKRHEDDEYGVVMISDIARHVLARDKSPDRVNAYEIMTKPVICVEADMDIRYCARLFEKFGLSRVPVKDKGKIVGIVSLTRLVLQGIKT